MARQAITRISRNYRYLVPWAVSMLRRSNALEQRVPWIVYSARDRIATVLSSSSDVFEYGSGGSTLWFAERGCSVVSVEHDQVWFERVKEALNNRANQVSLHLISPSSCTDGSSDTMPRTDDPDWSNRSFRGYVSTIERYPDGSFDVVLVDGRARADCLERGWTKLRRGGLLVLDDSDRERYQPTMNRLPALEREDHFGLVPFSRKLGQTTIWCKR